MMRVSVNGISINVEIKGSGPALLLIHGFTGSASTWEARSWPGFSSIAVDLIGHGGSDSPADSQRYTMQHCVADLSALLGALGIEKAVVLGYSLGGRVALHLALHAPQRVAALILESSSPGIADPIERQARKEGDAALADRLKQEGIEPFVDYWQELPLFATQTRLPAALREGLRRQRLAQKPLGLANSLLGMGAGVQDPLWDRLRELSIPALIIAGALDEKYAEIARGIAQRLPQAGLAILPNAGHAVHLDQPQAFAAATGIFLSTLTAFPSPAAPENAQAHL